VSVTVTRAADRDRHADVGYTRPRGGDQLLLALTTLVAVLAIGLSYAGRVRTGSLPGSSRNSVVNLNAVTDARALEPALERVLTSPDDRTFAASHLLAYLQSTRKGGGTVRNVGAVLGATVPAPIAQRGPAEYQQRYQRAAERAAARNAATPAQLPLLTSDDLVLLKPAWIVRTTSEFRRLVLRWAVVYLIAIWVVVLVWWARGSRGDYALLAATHLLTAIGFALVLSRSDPLRDTVLFVRYTEGVVVGCLVFAATSLMDFRKATLATFTYVPLAGALLLSALLLLFGGGPAGSNATVNLGPVQPVEAIRLLLGLFLAGYFARRWELLRQIRGRTIRDFRLPAWLHLPRFDYLLPVTVGIAAALLFFFLQKDLGPALFVSCVFLATYAIARNGAGLAVLGLGVLTAGFYLGYLLNISSTLSSRVQMWQSAWDNAARGGDQIAQAIWALATGGLFGTGLGLGDTRYVPAGYTDLPFAAIGEELGFVGLLCVAAAFALIGWRGFRTALKATNDYGFFLATIVTLFLVLPVLIMAGGMLGVVPLTGVVTPFLSYGGSAMAANFAAVGILAAIRTSATPAASALPFRTGMRSLVSVLSVAAVALIAVLTYVQVLRADAYVVRPHLGLQADGARRYQYNQRVLDVVGLIPRGTVFDRNGLPLATNDHALVARSLAEYKKRNVDVEPCAAVEERCYPLSGYAFHLLGDVGNRRNWGAGNTSYVERDLQDRLRGFNDREAVVSATDLSGRAIPTIRRDYRDVIPLLRHRRQPGRGDVKAFLARARDVTLTVDAPFQVRVARILAKYASRTGAGRAAAVVIDPDTGHLLAVASYPFPDEGDEGGDAATDAVFDRARYGLYAPGSTFKLITAAAALRLDSGSWNSRFMCTRQPSDRVGALVPGYGVVRDDALDEHPHGSIAMRDAIVQSCNAYFAQLAVRIGPRALLDTASLVGVSVARDNAVARVRATLPQAGYGQGDVVATPLRMARVAASIANGGLLREPIVVSGVKRTGAQSEQPQRLFSPEGARLVAAALREAVAVGTGRNLAGHQWRIAGKTGTAEVAGAPSHAWFVGFAPYGGEKKIAFAVLVENAGYGGAIAAPAAGEIVSAAATSGLIR
jgi:cell division protein FtsI/penicillin-binding protein 2/cell division protein FtsW (lipid II flippase)